VIKIAGSFEGKLPPMREQIFFKSEEIKGEAKAFPFVRTNKDQET
jgi:hypothetical protein